MDTAIAQPDILLRLRGDATVERRDDGVPVLVEGHVRMSLPGADAALAALADGCTEDALLAYATSADQMLKLQMLTSRLETSGWLERSVVADGEPLATLRPLGHQVPVASRRLTPDTQLVASRFALMRVQDGETVLETPRVPVQIVLHQPHLSTLVAELAAPTRAGDVGASGAAGEPATLACLQLLLDASLLVVPGEEDARELAQWSTPDLYFHARSRVGRNAGGYGGSFRMEGTCDPLPAVKPAGEVALQFDRTDLDAIVEPSFTQVLESRRSIRAHDDDAPLTAAQLGEFLYRTARVRGTFSDAKEELSSRPYPGGGAIYELELYPLVHHVDGVEPGLYHYEPAGHALELVTDPNPRTKLLLEYGRRTGVMEHPPQVLLLVAARFGRAMWKYESMAYALTLKQVGVLYQTMYLVATSMGLAPCALGGGNSDAFAAATGLDYYAETSVGEFLLGSRPRDAEA